MTRSRAARLALGLVVALFGVVVVGYSTAAAAEHGPYRHVNAADIGNHRYHFYAGTPIDKCVRPGERHHGTDHAAYGCRKVATGAGRLVSCRVSQPVRTVDQTRDSGRQMVATSMSMYCA
jgi:hypothetical protein